MRRRKRGLGAVLALALLACGGGDGSAATDAPAPVPELSAVVAAKVRGFVVPEARWDPPADPAEVDGLLEMLASSQGRMRDIPRAAVAEELGTSAAQRLGEALRDATRPTAERIAAAELLAVLDEPLATERLVEALETATEPWLRQWCAYWLAATSQDWIVPRLVYRTRYEKDPATFVWIASTLARFENFSGLDALFDVASSHSGEEVRAQAQGQLDAIAARLELPAEEVRALWNSIDARRLPQRAPSPRLRDAVWRLVAELSSEHFQLRGVDDARYILARMGPWVAEEIAPALLDVDMHVRLHVAQVLERMGARAQVAGAHLVAALAEPLIAPAVAEALGRVGYPPALAPLLAATEATRPHELRVAATYSLGRLNLPEALPRVTAIFDEADAPADLRMAAATALVLLEGGDHAAAWLVEELAGDGDPAGAEVALETWLVQGERKGRTGFAEARKAWNELVGPPGVIPTLEQTRERWEQRAEELAGRLARLLP